MRPPTPAPDHPPHPYDPTTSAASTPLAPVHPPLRARRNTWIYGAIAALLLIVIIAGVSIAVSDRSSKTASSDDLNYQLMFADLQDSELTNLIFSDTFWESYEMFIDEFLASTPTQKTALIRQWLSDIDSQVTQFQNDLKQIQADYAARNYSDGSIPDSIRDLAVSHYMTWQQWNAAIVLIATAWVNDSSSSLSLYEYVGEVQPTLDSNIETSFKALCATLIETQPSDGYYAQAINDICATS